MSFESKNNQTTKLTKQVYLQPISREIFTSEYQNDVRSVGYSL